MVALNLVAESIIDKKSDGRLSPSVAVLGQKLHVLVYLK